MNWLERKVTNWLVNRLFQDRFGPLTEAKLAILNDQIIRKYEETFYEDNHATMRDFLSENLNNAFKRSACKPPSSNMI